MKICFSCPCVYYVLICITVTIPISDFHDLKCPSYSQWDLRAKAKCNTTEKYFCLFDVNEQHFTEFCGGKPSYDSAGFKAILLGNIDGEKCDDNRYQPFKFWTNGSANCVFVKSYCNEEGQVVFKEGTTTSDRQCRCDYTRGYDFVKRPNNPCYCVPSIEDCSCYVKTCPKGSILTPDYKCIFTDAWKASFQCDFISDFSMTTPAETLVETHLLDNKGNPYFRLLQAVRLSVVSIVLILLVLLTGFVLYQQHIYCGISKSETTADITLLQNMKELEKSGKEYWKQHLSRFVETKATLHVLNILKTEQTIMITGPPGCGKSFIAYYVAFKMEERDGYDFVVITHPNDILKYTGTSKRRLFVIDDVFGNHAINEYDVKWLDKLGENVNHVLSGNSNIKLIMTCRTHRFKLAEADKSKLSFKHINLISELFQLTLDESRKIASAYLTDDVRSKLNDDLILMYNCFPSLCFQFWLHQFKNPIEYFKYPYMFFKEEFDHFDKNSDINFITLALLVIQNNRVDMDFLYVDNDDHDRLLKDLAKDIGSNNAPFKHMIRSSLNAMVNTYTMETKSGFSFLSEEMFRIVACYIGKSVMRTILKYNKYDFFKNRFHLPLSQEQHSEFQTMLSKHLEETHFDRLLEEIKIGQFWSVFADHENNSPEFRKSFKNYLQTHLKAFDIKEDNDGFTALHIVSLFGYSEYISVFTKLDPSLVNWKDSNGRSALHIACLTGDVAVVKELMENGVKVNERDKENYTAFELACSVGYCDVVRLLSKNASMKQRTQDLRAPLHTACDNGNIEIIRLLLKYKDNINVRDKDGKTPLHLATKNGNEEIVRMLLKHGAKINNADNKGNTPLLIACQKGNIGVAELLLNNKADVNKVNEKDKSPLFYACDNGNRNLIDLIISYNAVLTNCDMDGNTLLHIACFRGNQCLVDILMKYFDVNTGNTNSKTPLHLASKNGCYDVVFSLVNRGASVNKVDKYDRTPLHETCREGFLNIAEVLLTNGAHVNIRDKYGKTPLFMCCDNAHPELATILLNNQADLNIKDRDGLTPLHAACRSNDKDTVKAILVFTPNVNHTDEDGRSPLYIACENKNIEIVSMLLRFNADVNQSDIKGKTPLHVLSQNGCVEIIEFLMKFNATVNQLDIDGQIPSFKAVSEGHVAGVELLTRNADVSISDKEGMTPLHVASQCGNSEIIQSLINSNASVNVLDNLGQTPLFKAVSEGHIAAVELLTNNKALVDIRDKSGKSPLDIASKTREIDIADLLKTINEPFEVISME